MKPPMLAVEESRLGFARHTTAVVDDRCCPEGDSTAAIAPAAAVAAEVACDIRAAAVVVAHASHPYSLPQSKSSSPIPAPVDPSYF